MIMLDPDANSAKALAKVAVILQGILFAIGVAVLSIALVALLTSVNIPAGVDLTSGVTLSIAGVMTTVFISSFAIGVLWLFLDYYLVYVRLREERVTQAETPALVLGILQLVLGGVVPGILLIIAYVKIRDSESRQRLAHPSV